MAVSETSICNMALTAIGAKRINNVEDSSVEAIACRTYFEHVRDAMLRSYDWPFARARAILSEDTDTPSFGYDRQFFLPSDFLRLRNYYDYANDGGPSSSSAAALWRMEGKLILTDYEAVYLRYIKKMTDPAEFDPLFIEILVISLSIKLLYALAGIEGVGSTRDRLNQDFYRAEARARLVAACESDPHDVPAYIQSQFTDTLLVV